jgi:hypothetical protein
LLDDIRVTPYPKMSPSEAAYVYGGLPVWDPTVRSLDLPLMATLGVTGSEKRTTCTQLNQTRQSEQLILNKTYLTKVVINSRFLNM